MTVPDPDTISRTVLLGLHDGSQPTVEAAHAAHAATGVIVIADDSACAGANGQAALLTAVATASRAFGQVAVCPESPHAVIHAGINRGSTLADVITRDGATLISVGDLAKPGWEWPTLLIGATTQTPPGFSASAPVLRSVWDGWTATATPAAGQISPAALRQDLCVLAAIAAAALGVSEVFSFINARPGSDAGYRTIALNLWNPADTTDKGPRLAYAPAAWWLVGLGHLGQAYSWVLSLLNYEDPSQVQVVLQDTDKTTPANHSTGLLTPAGSNGLLKTRLVAAALDIVGFDTRIIERRLFEGSTIEETDVQVALLGVDNLPTRKLISGVGWQLAVDAGLGSGSSDFSAILVRRFPGAQPSHDVPGWSDPATPQVTVPSSAAFEELSRRGDACGLVELAGKAVGAAFVGAVAACLVVAEAVRELHGGKGLDVVAYSLDIADPSLGAAKAPVDVISLTLRF